MWTSVNKLGVILLVLQTCLLTVLCAEDLTEAEMRELDIFKMDERYDKIYRTKRTDNDTSDEFAGSGELPLEEDNPLNETNETATNTDTQSPDLINPREDVNASESSTTDATDTSEIDSGNGTNLNDVTTPRASVPDAIPEETVPSQGPPPPVENDTTANLNDTSEIDSGNGTNLNDATIPRASVPDAIPEVTVTTQAPAIVPLTNKAKTVEQEPDSNKTAADKQENPSHDSRSNNSPKAAAPPVQQNPPTSPAPESTKPTVGESGKSNVSGSGVLFTIVILAIVAALGGFGYFMYKKRKTQYDPVAVQDVEKEMTEVRSENGYFGKPITEEEVRMEDQLTPLHPQAAPRSFSPDSPEDKDLEKVEIVKGADEDRQKREQSVEFEEEKKSGGDHQ